MSEGGLAKEGQPIITNIFPVSAKSALAAFRSLHAQENPAGAMEAIREEVDDLQANSHILDYLIPLLDGASEKDADEIFWGSMISHRTLREEAESKGGKLPTFTAEFLERYHTGRVKSIMDMAKEKRLTIPEARFQLHRMELIEFENTEPEFNEIVKNKLSNQTDWHAEQDSKFLGILYMHLLFKKGCSDPKNYTQ